MIKVRNLTKIYGEKTAVDNVSFDIERGKIYGFLGQNGAGKSTTMNIITGCLSATDGSVTVDGHDIFSSPIEAKRRIGYLPEIPPLYPDMTPFEYLVFVAKAKGVGNELAYRQVKEAMELTQISDVSDRLIKTLSKGYKQRVGIAQALVGNPPVLIFDEPTVGLDPKQIVEVRTLIKQLGQKHTVILSTHILSEVQAVCDRIIIINKGKIVANEKTEEISKAVTNVSKLTVKICGPEKEVQSELRGIVGVSSVEMIGKQDADSVTFVVESQPGVDLRKPLFRLAAAKSWPIIGMEAQGLNLEDVFITAVDEEEGRPGRKEKKNRKGGR